MSPKSKKTIARLDLTRLLGLARSAVSSQKPICIHQTPLGPALRVAISSGPCLLGQDRAGSIKMQGYGLIEAARILGCDKGTHFLISKKLWIRAFGGRHKAKFSARGCRANLRIDGRLWRGKAKA